jgi:serine/threonine protein kinase
MNAEHPVYEFLDPPQQDGELGRLGPYRVLELLGQGGMGAVFHALDGRLKRDVALKMMQKKWAATMVGRKRFVEEARSMAAVHHDNVATIFEVGVHRGVPFMAMEMLKGQPLDKLIKGKEEFSYQQVLRLALEVSRGLAAAHACGIIHRDIKPANIWIEESTGRAKILDFGLAIAGSNFDRFSARGSVLGSPAYLSPEQSRGEPLDDRTDLYSLGIVLYQMCAGRLPLVGKSIPEQLIANICRQPTPLAQRNPDIPTPLCKLIHQLLEKEPRNRPRSARDLEQQIEAVSHQCMTESQAALQIVTETDAKPPKQPATKSATEQANASKPAAWIAAVVAGTCLLFGLIWWFLRSDTDPDPARVVEPSGLVQAPGRPNTPQPRRVTAISLRPLELTPINAGTRHVNRGEAARYRMRLVNQAADSAHDPRVINAEARVVAQIVTLLTPQDSNRVVRPTFAKKFSPSQLPRPGESKEVEILFLTDDLAPTSFEVAFELQSPAGDPISRIRDTLQVAENFSEGELLGFERLRTHAGRGADTYVATEVEESFGDRAQLRTLRKGGQSGPQQEHIYLRFDLSKSQVSKDALDRAVLLLSVQPGGLQGKSTINVYGIQSRLEDEWKETGEASLNWNNSPCRDGIGGQQYLGQLVIDNFKDHLGKKTDEVRFFSTELDDFLRSAAGDLVTIVLIRENVAEAASSFKSKEGKPNEAPALALRPKRPAP